MGRDVARQAVFQYVGPSTIVIGHGAQNHPDGMSLKALAMKQLGRVIQVGKKGHDSLEDALAARDLIHAHIAGLKLC